MIHFIETATFKQSREVKSAYDDEDPSKVVGVEKSPVTIEIYLKIEHDSADTGDTAKVQGLIDAYNEICSVGI